MSDKAKSEKCCSTWGLGNAVKVKALLGLQRGGLDKVTPALQVVIIRYLLGDFNKGNNRMNSSKRFTLQYIGFCPCCCSDVGAV